MFISNTHVCLKSIKVWIHTTNDDNKMTWVEKVAFSLISCNLPSLTKIFQSPFPPLTIIYLIPHFSPQKHFIFSYKNLQIWNTWILHSILTLILLLCTWFVYNTHINNIYNVQYIVFYFYLLQLVD